MAISFPSVPPKAQPTFPPPSFPPLPRPPHPGLSTLPQQVDVVEIQHQPLDERAWAKAAVRHGLDQPTWQVTDSGLLLEQGKPQAKIAVMDTYGYGTQMWEAGHGELTSAVALRSSGLGEEDLLRVDNSLQQFPNLPDPKADNYGQALDSFLVDKYAGFAHTTADNIETIHRTHPSVTTISHSQGVSASDLTQELYEAALQDPTTAQALGRHLGLPEGSFSAEERSPQAAIAIAGYVQDTLRNSPEVDRLQGTLSNLDGKVRYFASAGNGGDFQEFLRAGGFEFEPRFQGTLQNEVPLTETIGAARPLLSPSGERMAVPESYSQRTQVDASALGSMLYRFDPDGPREQWQPYLARTEGTSISTPVASATHAASPQNYENAKKHALPPLGQNTEMGAGMLDISF